MQSQKRLTRKQRATNIYSLAIQLFSWQPITLFLRLSPLWLAKIVKLNPAQNKNVYSVLPTVDICVCRLREMSLTRSLFLIFSLVNRLFQRCIKHAWRLLYSKNILNNLSVIIFTYIHYSMYWTTIEGFIFFTGLILEAEFILSLGRYLEQNCAPHSTYF